MAHLLIADLHLTGAPRDEYRWRLFPWLHEMINTHAVHTLFVLGDLTESKDYHSARLVNRIVGGLLEMFDGTSLAKLCILRGNHDAIDPECAYFRFLGRYPQVHYADTPYAAPFEGREFLLLPHSRDPAHDWTDIEDMNRADVVLMHQTVSGAKGENDTLLDGVPAGLLRRATRAKIYSGDVHVPQTVGRVEYVGAPYPIHFGDQFQGRAVLLAENGRTARDLHPPQVRRRWAAVRPQDRPGTATAGLSAGDQVKVRVLLAPAELGEWDRVKKRVVADCTTAGVELCGLELARQQSGTVPVKQAPQRAAPAEVLHTYCTVNKVAPALVRAGQSILNDVVAAA